MVCVLVLGVSLLVGYIYVLLCFSLLFLFFLLFRHPHFSPSCVLYFSFPTISYFETIFTFPVIFEFLFSCIYVLFYLISDHNFLFLFLIKIIIISFSFEHFCVSLTAFISYCSLTPCPTSLALPAICLYTTSIYLTKLIFI